MLYELNNNDIMNIFKSTGWTIFILIAREFTDREPNDLNSTISQYSENSF